MTQNVQPQQRRQTEDAVTLGRGVAAQRVPQQHPFNRRQNRGPPTFPHPNHEQQLLRLHNQARAPSNRMELKIAIHRVPLTWGTYDLWRSFERFGNISYIKVHEPRSIDKTAMIFFRPAPADVSWVGRTIQGIGPNNNVEYVDTIDRSEMPTTYPSVSTKKSFPERMFLPLLQADFGVMKDETSMLVMHSSTATASFVPQLTLDLRWKALFLTFSVTMPATSGGTLERHFKMKINPSQICDGSVEHPKEGNTAALILTLDMPPMVERKTSNIRATHEKGKSVWDDKNIWLRQTDIDEDPTGRKSGVKLRKENCIIDIARWLAYRLVIDKASMGDDIFQALADHNVKIQNDKALKYSREHYGNPNALWSALDPASKAIKTVDEKYSSLSDLQVMANDEVNLPFDVRYRLEVCLSQGVLHESNVNAEFMNKLSTLAVTDQLRACKILEKAAESQARYHDPDQIFRLQNQVSVVEKKRPGYCIKIPSANVTPSTIYYSTPVLETSNRIIRQFSKYESHFLRVKFTDEKYKGRIFADESHHLDEVYSRIKRTMAYGIWIGDRHYEFLAFGNSQFREHGAYFFCSTPSLSAQMIRDWMGNFRNIKVVAKYCSRLGQCFSTTRAIPNTVDLVRIPDVERNGFCFTDGVGKISPFLARLIASHFSLPNTELEYPAMFQFRLAGCKGVLAVDPALKGRTIEIRPSQEKFAAQFYGLEICRISQFSTAYLNTQLILVLSALGVPDEVFVGKLRAMLADLSEAMTSERKAKELLQKNIDFNQMTITLASMIFDGFMETKEPFMISCLRLWRSWSLKYLKEKARIYVEDGAFVLGGTDETQTLRGHFEGRVDTAGVLSCGTNDEELVKENIESTLPEIFLQIPDPDAQGKWKVVEEICVLARNPSLHPGDARIVRAVNVPALHHLKNCVVLPQTGDRDLANMCSGGDLDGDDYLVMWDKDLMPREWNHAPMDYTAPPPVESHGPVTVEDMTNFFVKHIKYDNLNRIAVAHRYWADDPQNPDGIKGDKCLQLAELHSKAVDFAKTGVPAEVPEDLRTRRWPHWAEPKGKSKHKIYQSRKILGKLYDEVKREPFHAAWEMPFDQRILSSCHASEEMLQGAREIKGLYDEAVRRIMAAHGIRTEFEVWTGFVLEHHQDINDYKFAENIGEIARALRQQHQEMCYERAGTNPRERDWERMKPFLVAMYTVTADEVGQAVAESKEATVKGGRAVPLRYLTFENMPFTSFPWLFARELGQIATGSSSGPPLLSSSLPRPVARAPAQKKQQPGLDLLGDIQLPQLPEVNTDIGVIRRGDVLEVRGEHPAADAPVPGWAQKPFEEEADKMERNASSKGKAMPPSLSVTPPSPPPRQPEEVSALTKMVGEKLPVDEAGGESNEDETEQVTIDFEAKPSAFEAVKARFGFDDADDDE
ncbi:RNA-dependent RNA polymerase 1 [Lecanosticta acicola]|uniref:RNA-dependent RNA polymerase n=1 Tax=Lecanosticta acicola TaxID=111012 RepID=A0AAI8W1H5_9PEZI|nr:RNA-dependent RNA polymerase 1 [Lecanosticta acicola]